MNCPKCNQQIDPGAVFCGNCGQQIVATAPAAPVAPVSPGISPAPQVIAPVPPNVVAPSVPPMPPQAPAPQFAAPQAPTQAPAPQPQFAQAIANQQPVFGGAPQPFTPATAGVQPGVPAYALAAPMNHVGHAKSVLSVVFGPIGIIVGLIIPIVGLALGIAGIVLGTMSRATNKTLSTVGIILSSLAITASLAAWAYYVVNITHTTQSGTTKSSTSASATNNAATDCYTTSFTSKLTVNTSGSNCDMEAYNGSTLEKSSDAYKVIGDKQTTVTAANFGDFAKPVLEKDVQDNLPSFTVQSKEVGQFAGHPAYFIYAGDSAKGVAVVEAVVLNTESTSQNLFYIVHATSGDKTDLTDIEQQWRWK